MREKVSAGKYLKYYPERNMICYKGNCVSCTSSDFDRVNNSETFAFNSYYQKYQNQSSIGKNMLIPAIAIGALALL